jgi:hypothetical protein
VKLELLRFLPSLATFVSESLFKERLLEPVILHLTGDSVFQIREEAVALLVKLREQQGEKPGSLFTQAWLEECLENKAREFHIHEKFSLRIQTLFLI